VTVVIGVATVAVVLVGVVAATVVIGVLMVTVVATVTGSVGIAGVGRETVGTRSVEETSDGATSAVDERTDAGVASAVEPWVDARTALTLERSAPPGVRPASSVRLPERVAGAAAAVSVPIGAITRAATTPVVARPAATTTAAAPFATATCGMPACFSQRHNPTPPAVTPSV
jgi:hypothetical protein